MELLIGVVTSIIASMLTWIAVVAWRNRRHLSVVPLWTPPSALVRISVAALLRIQDDDSYVLFHTPFRPGAYGPPGGVIKHDASARTTLDRLGFRAERQSNRTTVMHSDLRGFVPAASILAFMRWLGSGDGRESAAECLRRELAEELGEVGRPEVAPLVATMSVSLVRTVVEPQRRAPGRTYRQVRRFDVCDLVTTDLAGFQLRERLLELARSGTGDTIVLATGEDIVNGRCGDAYVGPQAAYLLGSRLLRPDLPPVPHG